MRTQLLLLAIVCLLFSITLKLCLADRLYAISSGTKGSFDRIYYSSVFEHLPQVSLMFGGLSLVVVVFYNRMRSCLLWFVGKETHLLAFCCALIVSLQLLQILEVPTIYGQDSLEYLKLSNALFVHHSYSGELGFPTAYWPVGYPAYLTVLRILFGNIILAARLMNVLITLALVLTLYAVFKSRLNERERAVFIVVTALFPNLLFSSNVLLSDYLFTLLLWVTVLIFLRRDCFRYSFAAIGFVLAVMSYLRPVGLLLPVVIFLALWKEGGLKPSQKQLAVGLAVFVLVLAPWTVRNYSVFGTFVPVSTNGGYNFLMGNRTGAPGGVNHDFSYNTANANEAQESSVAVAAGLRDILGDPIQAIVRVPRKVFELYRRGDSSLSWAFKRTKFPLNPLLLSSLFYATNVISYFVIYISVLTIVGSYVRKNRLSLHPLFVILYGYIILVTMVFVGSERYLIPVFPVHQFLFAKFISARTSGDH